MFRNFSIKFKALMTIIITFLLLSSNIIAQCEVVTKINTKLKFGAERNAPTVQAWRYGNLATVVLVPGVHVNVDGSPRAYSVGNKGLTTILNGVKVLAKDRISNKLKYMDYDEYKNNYGVNFTLLWLEAEANNFGVGTSEFDAYALYVRDELVEDSRVLNSEDKPVKVNLVGNGKGSPKTQTVEGESVKYYISTTSSKQADFPSSDQRSYLDSGEIPAFVVPGRGKITNPIDPLTDKLGKQQLGWAYYPEKNSSTFAIGGDTGPAGNFGEATMAFQQLLRYKTILPIPHYKAEGNYVKCSVDASPLTWKDCLYDGFYKQKETNLLRAASLPKPTIFVIFNKDVKVDESRVTRELIQNKGKTAMENIGGVSNVSKCLKTIPELRNLLSQLN